MELTLVDRIFYLADFMSGDLLLNTLPLRNVQLSSTLDGTGTLAADLDLRDITPGGSTAWADLRAAMAPLRPGCVSIVPVIEGATSGTSNAMTSVCHGEWWLSSVQTSHADPVVKITGIEFSAYADHNVLTRNWKAAGLNPLGTIRQLWTDLTTSGQTIALDVGNGSGPPLTAVSAEWKAGGVTYASAMDEMAGDQLEWTVESRLIADGVLPVRVQRDLIYGAPRLQRDFGFDTLDITTPGAPLAHLVSLDAAVGVDDMCFDLWGHGAGSGEDQISERLNVTRPAGMPRISRAYTSRLQKSRVNLRAEIGRIMHRMDPAYAPFTVTLPQAHTPGGAAGPRIGHVWRINREPSHAMPESEQIEARVIAWSWRQPRPGEQDMWTATLERI